jgi:hypothetical protein
LKKIIPIFVIAFSTMIASCTVLMPQLHLSGVILTGKSEQKTSLVEISVQPRWENPGKGNKKLTGFYVEFRNTTNNPVFIVWEKSTLKYNNGAFSPFVQGQRYEDFLSPMNAMLIPPRGIVRKYIYSSQQPYREAGKSGNWKLRPIEADQVFLVFCVQSEGIVDYYTIEVR